MEKRTIIIILIILGIFIGITVLSYIFYIFYSYNFLFNNFWISDDMLIQKIGNKSCDKVNPMYKKMCYIYRAKENLNVDYCYKIKNPERDDCIKDIAYLSKNIDICYRLSQIKKEYCLARIYAKNNDISLCRNLTINEAISSCITDIATINNNSILCNETLSDESRGTCLLIVARKLNNLSLCNDIGDVNMTTDMSGRKVQYSISDNCFSAVMDGISNLTIDDCNLIPDNKSSKTYCYNRVSKNI